MGFILDGFGKPLKAKIESIIMVYSQESKTEYGKDEKYEFKLSINEKQAEDIYKIIDRKGELKWQLKQVQKNGCLKEKGEH